MLTWHYDSLLPGEFTLKDAASQIHARVVRTQEHAVEIAGGMLSGDGLSFTNGWRWTAYVLPMEEGWSDDLDSAKSMAATRLEKGWGLLGRAC